MTPLTRGSNRRSCHGFRCRPGALPTLPLLLVALGACAAGALWPAAARAQTPPALTADQKQEMKIHYERGQRAYDIGKYADAIDEYAKVYEIGGNPTMLYNI